MSILEKIQQLQPNEVRLYREGVFWVAYEQSAWHVSRVKTLKPTKKIVKSLGREVVSVGFPDSVLAKILENFEAVERSATTVICRGKAGFVPAETGFEDWKAGIPVAAVETALMPSLQRGTDASLVEKIRAFDVSNSTPVECMLFISELKKTLANGNLQ